MTPKIPPPGYKVESLAGDDDVEQLGWHAWKGGGRYCVRGVPASGPLEPHENPLGGTMHGDGKTCFFETASEALAACWADYEAARTEAAKVNP